MADAKRDAKSWNESMLVIITVIINKQGEKERRSGIRVSSSSAYLWPRALRSRLCAECSSGWVPVVRAGAIVGRWESQPGGPASACVDARPMTDLPCPYRLFKKAINQSINALLSGYVTETQTDTLCLLYSEWMNVRIPSSMCWRMSSVRSGRCWILCLSRSPILARCSFWRCSWNEAGVLSAKKNK